MGFFDFLANKNNMYSPYNPAATPDANEGRMSVMNNGGFDYNKLFSDPNFLQALGAAGAGLSQGQPVGQALGNAAIGLTKNRAMQGAAAKQLGGQDERLKMILDAIGGSGLVSPVSQNNAADYIKVDGDGSWTMGMKNTPQKPTFGGEEQALESRSTQPRQRRTPYGEANFL